MKARIIKYTGVFLLVVFLSSLFGWPVERVRVTVSSISIVDDFENYYFMAGRMSSGSAPTPFGGVGRRYIYFLPGQKARMLEKIKEDVTNYLEAIIKEPSDIFYKYEISVDFMQVFIYETANARDINGRRLYDFSQVISNTVIVPNDLDSIFSRIRDLIPLYHNIKTGRTTGFHQMIRIIEDKSWMQ